jgi:hypothetical protein
MDKPRVGVVGYGVIGQPDALAPPPAECGGSLGLGPG